MCGRLVRINPLVSFPKWPILVTRNNEKTFVWFIVRLPEPIRTPVDDRHILRKTNSDWIYKFVTRRMWHPLMQEVDDRQQPVHDMHGWVWLIRKGG